MDSERFDGFVRTFGQTRSRRQTLRGLAGVLAVGVLALGERSEEAGAHNPLKKCKKIDDKQKKRACIKKAKAHNATHTVAAPVPSGTSACTPNCSGGRNCGSDGCNGSCGSCTAPQTCGGGGTAGVCGCTPTTCAAQNRTCGQLADGCGTTLDCGTCATGQRCAGGSCVCDAQSGCAGCCDGTTCKASGADGVCGSGGAACRACVCPALKENCTNAEECTEGCEGAVACGPIGDLGQNQCCRPIGAPCSSPGQFDECCTVVFEGGGADLVYCAANNTCGGPGARCFTSSTCASGVCCGFLGMEMCCAAGQQCQDFQCTG